MTALTQGRATAFHSGGNRIEHPAAAGVLIYEGGIVARDAAGNLTKGQTAVGLVGVGIATHRCDNSNGVAGAVRCRVAVETAILANDSGDAVTAADIGKVCYLVDDQTVAKTHATNTRSPAGIVADVTPAGVAVRFDEALTRAAL